MMKKETAYDFFWGGGRFFFERMKMKTNLGSESRRIIQFSIEELDFGG